MTTNAFQIYDDLRAHVHSVTLVHPPHVALITRAQVMTDSIAALTLARLHAVGLLPSPHPTSTATRGRGDEEAIPASIVAWIWARSNPELSGVPGSS